MGLGGDVGQGIHIGDGFGRPLLRPPRAAAPEWRGQQAS